MIQGNSIRWIGYGEVLFDNLTPIRCILKTVTIASDTHLRTERMSYSNPRWIGICQKENHFTSPYNVGIIEGKRLLTRVITYRGDQLLFCAEYSSTTSSYWDLNEY